MKFTALTFNMQFGQVWDDADPDNAPVDLGETIEFLHGIESDIILLQEVERGQPGGEQPWPPANFKELQLALPAYHSVFAYPRPNPAELPFGIALAIFAKSPLGEFESYDLPPPPITFEFEGRKRSPSYRQLIQAKTSIAGRTVQILNTHLQAFFMIGASSNEHREQRDRVELALRAAHGPAFIGGDFNCAPEEDLVKQFAAAGYRPAQTSEITWRRRPYVLDHLFYNGGLSLDRAEVLHTCCSDHHALLAEFHFAR